MRLKDVKPKVRSILKEYEEARNNDGYLQARYIAKYHSNLIVSIPDPANTEKEMKVLPLSNFRHLPPLESIRRTRAIIQNNDKEFPPTLQSVREARKIKEEDYRNWEIREAIEHKSPEIPYSEV